ncbi:hypothetical protein C8R45DRAFT_1218966 [Mycena sanguinolenta]|nr:hypothetical protein C8R45DRAFT_1218966 [Mycena sanguinolenta]
MLEGEALRRWERAHLEQLRQQASQDQEPRRPFVITFFMGVSKVCLLGGPQEEPEEREAREERERQEQEEPVRRWRAEERDRQERAERAERECAERERIQLQRRARLLQMLLSPPEGVLLTLLSSFIFIMLAVLALELIGWFMFLGLLVTILAYLLLIILFVRWEIHRRSLRSSSSNLARITLAAHWYFVAKVYMDTLHIPFNFSSYYYP